MDPNETLDELRAMAIDEIDTDGQWSEDTANERLTLFAEYVTALDGWLSSGGFLPEAWAQR